MGSGASIAKDSLKPLLLSQELVEGSTALVSDRLYRDSFTNYIKSGVWLDSLSQLIPDFQSCSSGDIPGKGHEHLSSVDEYGVDDDKLIGLKTSSNGNIALLSPSFHNSAKSITVSAYGDLYSGETNSFSHEELLVILFSTLYPIYLSSKEFERFLRSGDESGKNSHDDNSSTSLAPPNYQGTRLVQTNQSKRAQDILLGCAAHFDESFLQDYLREPAWLPRVCSIFQDHPLGLCIIDAAKSGQPILFANKVFCGMFGFEESELLKCDFSVLNGPCTEMAQLKVMQSSIHSTEIVKFYITLQSKAKKPLLALVAQKAVGSYSISAHFVKTRSSKFETLKMVDDVLILLSYLVKAPELPPRPTWLPAPIVTLALATSSLLSPSPSSARSRSSSISRSSALHSSRNGKGAPSSVRSFGSTSLSSGRIFAARTVSASASASGGSSAGSVNNSFFSNRSTGTQRHARGAGAGTPVSCRSAASTGNNEGYVRDKEEKLLSEVAHVPVDLEATMEYSMCEPAQVHK